MKVGEHIVGRRRLRQGWREPIVKPDFDKWAEAYKVKWAEDKITELMDLRFRGYKTSGISITAFREMAKKEELRRLVEQLGLPELGPM